MFHLAPLAQVCTIKDWVLLLVVEVCQELSDCNLESMQCPILDSIEPVLVDHVLPVVWPILDSLRAVVEHAMPVHRVSKANFLVITSMRRPEVSVLTPVNMILFRENLLVLLRVRINVILQLQKLFFVDGEHRKLIARLRIGHILLGKFNGADAHTPNCLSYVVKGGFDDLWVLNINISPAFLPVL